MTPEEHAQADRCDREKIQNLYRWMLYQDPPAKQQPKEPTEHWTNGPD